MSDAFDALAHPVRREILKLLRTRPTSAGEIAKHFTITKPTLSGHFAVLKAADLVRTERRGATIIYHLNMSVLEEAAALLLDLASGRKKERPRKWAAEPSGS
ncbi:MAG TPA: autorepressor SdpR family transcription factor [Rhizomicrobium sp.]|jgi:DNA-binding transcriptional ArsR family regulator|nr:autorepressor SdpR family transcription factor [Rhizomicrobium sp.]